MDLRLNPLEQCANHLASAGAYDFIIERLPGQTRDSAMLEASKEAELNP